MFQGFYCEQYNLFTIKNGVRRGRLCQKVDSELRLGVKKGTFTNSKKTFKCIIFVPLSVNVSYCKNHAKRR